MDCMSVYAPLSCGFLLVCVDYNINIESDTVTLFDNQIMSSRFLSKSRLNNLNCCSRILTNFPSKKDFQTSLHILSSIKLPTLIALVLRRVVDLVAFRILWLSPHRQSVSSVFLTKNFLCQELRCLELLL